MSEDTYGAGLASILRDRPERVTQQFPLAGRMTLLCPPDGSADQYQSLQIALGPFSGAVLLGAYQVGLQARMDELDDLWTVIMAEAFPTLDERMSGGEPRASTRTATLGWRLLAALGSAIETLAGVADAIDDWRSHEQPTGSRCSIGNRLLGFSTTGADSVALGLRRFADAATAASVLGYPSQEVLSRHVTQNEATLLARRCERSAGLAGVIFQEAAEVVADPFWRTFVKWKHGIAVTSPAVAPLWLPETADLNVERTTTRLNTGIVVFDARGEQSLYVWPAERTDFVLYSTFAAQILDLCHALLGSVLGYARVGPPALHWFEIDKDQMPDEEERAALEQLSSTAFPIAALAGQWR